MTAHVTRTSVKQVYIENRRKKESLLISEIERDMDTFPTESEPKIQL